MKVKRRMSKLAEMIGSNDRKIRMHLLHREKGGEPGTAREGPETRALREAGHPHDTIKRQRDLSSNRQVQGCKAIDATAKLKPTESPPGLMGAGWGREAFRKA